jgi:hypothetical protein
MLAIPEPPVAFVEPEGARLRVVLPLDHTTPWREVPVPEILLSRTTVTIGLSPVQIVWLIEGRRIGPVIRALRRAAILSASAR